MKTEWKEETEVEPGGSLRLNEDLESGSGLTVPGLKPKVVNHGPLFPILGGDSMVSSYGKYEPRVSVLQMSHRVGRPKARKDCTLDTTVSL